MSGKKQKRQKRRKQKRQVKHERRREKLRQRSGSAPLPPAHSGPQVALVGSSDGSPGLDLASAGQQIDWKRATAGVPAGDMLDGLDLDNRHHFFKAISDFIRSIESDYFLNWEAVIREEQDLPLSEAQEEHLSDLINFGDEEDEGPILHINEIPRPTMAWYETLRRLAARLLLPVVRTSAVYNDMQIQGWLRVREILRKHAGDLSLPPGVSTPEEVVPAELRHRLEMQLCFDVLIGIGQGYSRRDQSTLQDTEQHWRVDQLVTCLQKQRKSVAYLKLTLEGLREILELPSGDREIFEALLRDRLDLTSDTEPIAERLSPRRKPLSTFDIGDSVRVKSGVRCPDDDPLSITGWQGRIFEIDEDGSTVGIRWDSVTLADLPASYIKESEAEGLDWAEMYLGTDDIELSVARDSEEEVEGAREGLHNKYRWIDIHGDEAGERIQAVIAGVDEDDELGAWVEHLSRSLVLPFDAEVTESQERGTLKQADGVRVNGISEADDLPGVLVDVTHDGEHLVFPLCDLTVIDSKHQNFQAVEDYCFWFANR